MLLMLQLPKNLWPKTIHHAIWLKNRMSTWALNDQTPYEVMHHAKPNLVDLPDLGARDFVMKTNTGKLDNKGTEGHWFGYSGMSKGHHIYAANQQITVKCNVSFEDMVLWVPNIPIAGGDKNNHIIKSSNQNTMALQLKQPVKHWADTITHDPSVAPGTSTDNKQVNEIMRNLENNLSDQPLRRSTRLNPPPVQNPELELKCSKCLKQ